MMSKFVIVSQSFADESVTGKSWSPVTVHAFISVSLITWYHSRFQVCFVDLTKLLLIYMFQLIGLDLDLVLLPLVFNCSPAFAVSEAQS